MPWMESDIDSLIELVDKFCTPEQCNEECPFWVTGNSQCLKEIAYSLRADYNQIRDLSIKFIKGLSAMLQMIFNELTNTGLLPDMILIMIGIYIYLMIKNEKENRK